MFPSEEKFHEDINAPALVTLPPLSHSQYDLIDSALERIYQMYCPLDSELLQREEALENLQGYLNTQLEPKCDLNLFGSSRNGFGLSASDMDICMTFKNYTEDPPECYGSAEELLTDISEILMRNDMVTNVSTIINTRVPIVKFNYLYDGKLYQSDISYYNMLAQRNTELLALYANLDIRCKKLGYVLKGKEYFFFCSDNFPQFEFSNKNKFITNF